MSDVQKQYVTFVAERAKDMGNATNDLLHAAVGISGEAGEIIDAVKKTWVYTKPIDKANLHEELGDLLFYVQMICNTMSKDISEDSAKWSIDDIIIANMEKLTKRYPKGYTDALAQARLDKVEG